MKLLLYKPMSSIIPCSEQVAVVTVKWGLQRISHGE